MLIFWGSDIANIPFLCTRKQTIYMLKRILLLLSISLLIGQFICAQVTTSSISGTHYRCRREPCWSNNNSNTSTYRAPVTLLLRSLQAGLQSNNMRVGGPYQVTVSFVGLQTSNIRRHIFTAGRNVYFKRNIAKTNQTLENVVVTWRTQKSI